MTFREIDKRANEAILDPDSMEKGISGERELAAEDYWVQKFAGELPILDLPTDYPRPAEKNYAGSSVVFDLPANLSEDVRELNQKLGATLFQTMLAFFEILLHKYSRQEELVIGITSVYWSKDQSSNSLDLDANTFAVRQQVWPEDSLPGLVERIKKDLLESSKYRDYPFTELASKLHHGRNSSRSNLFDVMYIFHNVHAGEKSAGRPTYIYEDLTLEQVKKRAVVSECDLKLEFAEGEKQLQGKIEYSTQLFTQATIERMAEHFTQIVREVLEHPEKKLANVSLITEGERRKLLYEFNATQANFAAEQTIDRLFAEQVRRTPENIAILDDEQQLSYRELDDKSTHVAGILRKKGVTQDSIVAIMVERSIAMMIGIFAIVKAGGAYLPIDPAFPEERIRFMLQDSQARLMLVHAPTVAGPALEIEQLNLDDEELYTQESRDQSSQETWQELQSISRPHDLVYVIYTSGSTGKPKGTMIEHISLINRLQWMQKQYPLDGADTILHKTPFIFDVSVWEIFWWSLAGAKLCLLGVGDEKEPERLLEMIYAHQITTMHFIPSMLNAFLEYVSERPDEIYKLSSLRRVFASGEALKKATVLRFNELLSTRYNVKLHNLYGPTEAAIDVSHFDCLHEIRHEIVPIGRPIDNIKLYVVDKNLELTPIGLPGEICIAGVGLARGYLNLPELTAEKFIANPFKDSAILPGDGTTSLSDGGFPAGDEVVPADERMYRTGDLGRYRADGNIEFLGRLDHQVKLRGFRIELGELEANLLTHPAVQEAVVLVKEDQAGDQKLIAYIASRQEVNPAELRQHMLQSLPEYMIPHSFISVEQMPQLPNGKIDRKSLLKMKITKDTANAFARPRTDSGTLGTDSVTSRTDSVIPGTDSGTLRTDPATPRADMETKLVELWARILNTQEVGIHDKFFELGGDSIKAIQLVSEINKLGFNLKVKDIMKYQTIHQIMSDKFEDKPRSVTVEEAEDQLVEGQLPLTPIQHWFFSKGFARPHHWNHSLLVQLQPEVNLEILRQAFHKLIEHHDVLRLIYHSETRTLFHHNLALEEGFELLQYDLSSLTKTQQEQKLVELGCELKASLNLAAGPLMRVGVFYLSEGGRRLLITIHHLVIDGVSWRIFLQDLQELYTQLLSGQGANLPPKTTAYKNWAYQLCKYSKSLELRKEIPYWEEISRAKRPLPYDKDCGEQRLSADRHLRGELPIEATQAFLTKVHNAYNTNINEILLTALALALHDWTGQNEQVIDLEGHGREELFTEVDTSRTVGWFTALYPVKLNISKPHSIGHNIKEIKEALRTIPNGGIGYGILRYLTKALDEPTEEQSSRIIFNYLGQFDAGLPQSLFSPASEMSGADMSPENQRTCLLEIIGCISEDKLQMSFTYSQNRYYDETIAKLLDNYLSHLNAIIAFCTSGENIGYSPSDFEMVELSQNELDEISEGVGALLEGLDLDIDFDLEEGDHE